MSEAINKAQNAEAQKKIEQQKNQSEQKENQALIKAINKNFDTFNAQEKTKLFQLIKAHFKSHAPHEKKQLYIKIAKFALELKKQPKVTLQKLESTLKQRESDLINQRNKNKPLSARKQPNNKFKLQDIQRKNKINLQNIQESTNQHNTLKKTWSERVKAAYEKLPPKLKTFTPDQLQSKTAQLGPETQKKLTKQGIDPREYASFLLSRELIDQNKDQSPQTLDFLESLKNLENTLGIRAPEALPLPGVDKDYIKDNPNLIQHIKENPDFEELSGPINFAWLKTPAQNFKFVKTFGDKDLIQLQDQISTFFDEKGNLNPLDEEQKILFQKYRDALVQLKYNLTHTTGNLLKAGVIQAPASAMLRNYLDQDSLGPLNLNEQLKLGKNSSNIITENGNQILKINGKIDGKSLTFYYNLNNPNATLQCDDHINFDPNQNHISIGTEQKSDLKIKLPSQKELISSLHSICNEETLQSLLENSDSAEDYQSRLNDLIAATMQGEMSPDPLIQSRLCMQTEKNLTSQEFTEKFLPPHLMQQLQNENIINNTPQIKKLFQILDYISENSTSQELITLRKGFKKLSTIIQNPQHIDQIADPVAKQHFFKLHQSLQSPSTPTDWSENLLNFFNLFLKYDFKNQNFDPQSLESSQIFNFFDFENFLNLPNLATDLKSAHQENLFSLHFNTLYNQNKESTSDLESAQSLTSLEIQLEESFAFA